MVTSSHPLPAPSAASAAIQAHDVHVWYRDRHALQGASLAIAPNEITAFIGPSGSGKSTFLRCMNRMVDTIPFARVSGTITVQGANILDAETDVIGLRRSVGMVFQNPVPFPKSIYENIAYGLTLCGKEHTWWKRWPQAVRPQKHTAAMMEESTHPIDRQVAKSLKDAALWEEVKDRLDQSAYQLSGGQQQRLCIARAIAVAPTILLLDEPCSELDPISTHRIEQTLLQLKAHYTIVIVTHNLQQARRISDHTAFFHAGKLVEFARTKELFEQPKEQLTKDYVQGNFG